jgi:hypothetical protein
MLTSYQSEVMAAMAQCKKEFCEAVGVLAVAEIQPITPVNKLMVPTRGNLKKSITFEVIPGNLGVSVGANESAPYAIDVEKGLGQPAQPFLEPGAMNAIPKIFETAERIYKKMGG